MHCVAGIVRRDRNRAVKHAEWYVERSVAGLVAGSVRHSTDSLRWTREPCEPHDSGAISLDDKWTRAVWVAAWLRSEFIRGHFAFSQNQRVSQWL